MASAYLLPGSRGKIARPPMNSPLPLGFRVLALAPLSSNLLADTVETRDGSRFVGKVTSIDAGVVTIDTVPAGTITIKQTEVTAIATSVPSRSAWSPGPVFDGAVSTQNGVVQITGRPGTHTTIPKLRSPGRSADPDPAAGHWVTRPRWTSTARPGTRPLWAPTGFSAKRIAPRTS